MGISENKSGTLGYILHMTTDWVQITDGTDPIQISSASARRGGIETCKWTTTLHTWLTGGDFDTRALCRLCHLLAPPTTACSVLSGTRPGYVG